MKKNVNKAEKGKFSKTVIEKVINLLKKWIAWYMENFTTEELKVCISSGNKKIGHVLNVSLAPIVTCLNCAKCMYYCYDIKAVLAYPSALMARARNTAIFRMDRDYFFSALHKKMKARRKDFYLRFHVSGEIVDLDHFSRMVETARIFPNYKIWTYTKVYWIVNEYVRQHGGTIESAIPDNFSVMFSRWPGVEMVNPYGFAEFGCAMKEEDKKGFHCPGNCNICKAGNCGCIGRETVWADLH